MSLVYSTGDGRAVRSKIEHPINHDAGEGDVKPQREAYLCDFSVLLNLHVPSPIQGDEGQRNDDCRENDMADQDE